MSTLIAAFIAIACVGMLITYLMGISAGKKEGYEAGRKDGYDRGREEREDEDDEESEKSSGGLFSRIGCGVVCCAWIAASLALVARVVAANLAVLGNF